MSRAKAKHALQSSTQHTLEDIELLLKHMEYTGRIVVQKVNEQEEASDDNTVIKFVDPTDKDSRTLSKKEIAVYSLE